VSVPCLAVDSLHSYYGESHILRGISFTVPDRGVVALLGKREFVRAGPPLPIEAVQSTKEDVDEFKRGLRS